MALIFTLSSLPRPPEPPGPLSLLSDKALHALVYAGLAALVIRALTGRWLRPVTLRVALFAAAAATLYGVTDEIHQHFVPPREADALDLVADAFGAALAAIGLHAWSAASEARRRGTIIRGRHGL
jgi:VanZ family protein